MFDSEVLELTGGRIGDVSPTLSKWIAEGNDPLKAAVQEAGKRGIDIFYSYRPNDIHDGGSNMAELATFKLKHPEWMIGKQPYGRETHLNFAIPDVRKLKLAYIEEVFRKYDFDGLLFDFMRSPPYFLPGEEPGNAPVLSGFLGEIREMLDRRGRERDCSIELAVRVGETVQACRLDGFDVATWMREGLIDILILGSGVIDIHVEAFRELSQGTGVLIYPCLYGWPSGYNPIPAALARGLALNYWAQGADGIYTQNWFPYREGNEYQVGLLKEIGDPASLATKSLMFAADRGKPVSSGYSHNWMQAVLPLRLVVGQAVEIPILVCADLGEASGSTRPFQLTMQIEFDRLPPALPISDGLRFTLNGTPLRDPEKSKESVCFQLSAGQLERGTNRLVIEILDPQPEKERHPLIVNAAEIRRSF